jgi:putative transposase
VKEYRHGAHSVFEIHLHLVWTTKYRKRIMAGEVGLRVRELTREVCRQHEVTILRGHVSSDHVHLLVSIPPQVTISRLVQWLKGRKFASSAGGVCPSAESVLGSARVGARLLLLQQRKRERRGDQEIHRGAGAGERR